MEAMERARGAPCLTMRIRIKRSGNTFGTEQSLGTRTGPANVAWQVLPQHGGVGAQVIYDDNPTQPTGNIHAVYNGADTVIGSRTAAYKTYYRSFWLADLHGAGNPDIVYIDSNSPSHIHVIAISNGGTDTDVATLSTVNYNVAGHARMADVDGDGLLDFIYDTPLSGCNTEFHVLKNLGNGSLGPDTACGMRTINTPFKMADVNGDGLADIVYSNGATNLIVMLSSKSTLPSISFQSPALWGTFSSTNYTDFYVADVNGDGLPDIVYLNNQSGSFMVLLNSGTAFQTDAAWGAAVNSPNPGYALADVNGDGLPDIVYDSSAGLMVLTNTGSSFMAETKWGTRKYPYSTRTFSLADANFDGLSDFVYDAVVGTNHQIEVVPAGYGASELSHGPASDLMSSATTGIGGTYNITYQPSMVTPSKYLPYPVQTPSSVTSNDGNGNVASASWSYSSGYYDFSSREFRGFGSSVQQLPDSNIQYTFLQDDVGKGLMTDKLITSLDGSLKYREWQYLYDLAGMPYTNTHFPAQTQTGEIDWDQATPGTPRTIQTSFGYDAYGNITSRYQQGDLAVTGDERYDEIDYTYDLTHWIMATPSVIHTRSDQGLTQADDLARTTFTYHPGTNLVWTKDFWYKQGSPDSTITYTYDQYGNLGAQIDPNQNSPTTITCDSTHTFPQLVTDPAGHRTQTTYNYLFSKPAIKTDLDNNIATYYTYDVFGRIETIVDKPNDSATYPTRTYSYNNYGKGVGQQNVTLASRVISGAAGVYSKSMYFDGLGRVINQYSDGPTGVYKNGTWPNGSIRTDTVYDVNGRVWKKSVPFLKGIETEKWTTYTLYDPLGRLLTQLNPDTTSSTTAYAQGTTNYTDPDGHIRTELRDAYGQLTAVTQYQDVNTPFTTSYQYDPLGNLTDIYDPETNHTNITYDSLSRRMTMTDPDMGAWSYGYDSNGNLTSQTDANGNTIQFSYDAVNRITLKHLQTAGQGVQPSPDTSYTYDKTGTGYKYTIGRLTSVSDASGSTSFLQYDRDGHLLSQSSTVNGNLYTLNNAYDDLGRITQITYLDSDIVKYSHDTGGNMSGVTGSGTVKYATFTNFTGLGQPQGITYGNGVITSLSYNTATDSRLHSMVTTTSPAGGDVQVQNLTYGYDNDGNVLTITDVVDPTRDLSFVGGYDGLNRLTLASSSRQDYGQLSFQYSPSGNIEYNSRVGSYSYTGPQPHAATAAGSNAYSYDLNGNMTNRNGTAMAYDQENRLVQAGSYSYVYNYKGMRAVKNGGTPAATTAYLNNLYECTNGSCTKHIFAGTQRIASKNTAGINYYHPDHLGGLNVSTNTTGSAYSPNFYYPYGEDWISGSDGLHYKFTDQEKDSETGIYYYKARYYDPQLGRFTSPDPMTQAAFDQPTTPRLAGFDYGPNRLLKKAQISVRFFWL